MDVGHRIALRDRGPAKVFVMASVIVPVDQAMPLPDLEAYIAQAFRDGGCLPVWVGCEFVEEADPCRCDSDHKRRDGALALARDYYRAALARAAFVAEHLMQMIDPQTWRDTGGDDSQGHYEGDYHADATAAEISEWKAMTE